MCTQPLITCRVGNAEYHHFPHKEKRWSEETNATGSRCWTRSPSVIIGRKRKVVWPCLACLCCSLEQGTVNSSCMPRFFITCLSLKKSLPSLSWNWNHAASEAANVHDHGSGHGYHVHDRSDHALPWRHGSDHGFPLHGHGQSHDHFHSAEVWGSRSLHRIRTVPVVPIRATWKALN